ncbi:Uncharacterised protein [Mycobacterium tuberculosis]|uniref:Uncharacterized protein n=1 Tax=Mycobacterium tuberculosis TaxID=1773 RepID=A0A0T7LXK6_MYCTX|nr:Uncharacterised protein [Mycobacterium tuberculosis]CFE63807.1 Uncharacterised protein [Mycobacterium tuberculosis]CKT76753.1 Uncharacterised protein [Mycobacterium tuberculosis]COV52833.1 Uncharacterised protein [Mycobacterium tuberculosis]COW70194.1 Uncharacterised protein [Mycobacterium tuberculosis]
MAGPSRRKSGSNRNVSVVWSTVLRVRHASIKCSDIEHMSDYSVEHASDYRLSWRSEHDTGPATAYPRSAQSAGPARWTSLAPR